MRSTVMRSSALAILLSAPAWSMQLPPDIQADRYLLRAQRQIEEQDFAGAKQSLDRILTLEAQHGLELPAEFFFRYAKVVERLGLFDEAIEFLTKYLTIVGRDGEFYGEALELLDEAEENRFNAEQTCTGKPTGSACWLELTSHPGCHVWNSDLDDGETTSWSGECADRLAQGIGTIAWKSESGKLEYEETGSLRGGKAFGEWTGRHPDGTVTKGSYVDGKRQGQWVFQWPDKEGNLLTYGAEGPYVDGKQQGAWVFRYTNGQIDKGPMENGERHGQWSIEWADDKGDLAGAEERGPYVKGKRQGRWVASRPNGVTADYLYVDNKLHGKFVVRNKDGSVRDRLEFSNGEKHGYWRENDSVIDTHEGATGDTHTGRVSRSGNYEHGKRVGEWEEEFSDGCEATGEYAKRENPEGEGKEDHTWVRHGNWRLDVAAEEGGRASYRAEGPYVQGVMHGQWEIFWGHNDRTDVGSYVDGKRQGHWVKRFPSGTSWAGSYVNDEMHGEWVYRKKLGGGIKDREQWRNGQKVK